MQQAKVTLSPLWVEFLNDYKRFGFKGKSSMVQVALQRMEEQLTLQQLQQSANLYAELYEEEAELRELTETAITGWPD